MATKICTFIGIILLITSAVVSPIKLDKASANGATRIIVDDVQEGPFLFRAVSYTHLTLPTKRIV